MPQMMVLAAAPLAAINLRNLRQQAEQTAKTAQKSAKSAWKKASKQLMQFQDKANYQEHLPPIGSPHMSYAWMLKMLSERLVKRVILLGDGKVAIVEVGSALSQSCFCWGSCCCQTAAGFAAADSLPMAQQV